MNHSELPRLRRTAAVLLLLGSLPHALSAQGHDPDQPELAWQGQRALAGELMVVFEPQMAPSQRRGTHELLGAQLIDGDARRIQRVALPAGANLDEWVALYEARAGVAAAEPNLLVPAVAASSGDPLSGQQWALPKVRATQAWAAEPGDADVVVAVIDSGVAAWHPDLDDHYAWGWDTYADDADPADVDGHGTHCSGIAAAETGNGVGVAGAAGGCRFAAYRAGNASFPTSALVDAIDDAVAQGAQVLSMSWGSSYNNAVIRWALQDARDAGCVLVAAAGNDNTSNTFFPAGHGFVIGVASSSPADTRSSFSNYGSWVSVAAPGQGILSTSKSGGYVSMSGTSMAAPLVAGQAALLYARLGGVRSPGAALAVRAALQTSAVDVGGWVANGRVDFPASLEALVSPEPAVVSGVSPAQVGAGGGDLVTLTGTGLVGLADVTLDGEPVEALTVLDDTSAQIHTPRVTSLGTHTLSWTKGGASGSTTLTVTETHPPRLVLPAEAPVSAFLGFEFAGRALDHWVLLVSLAPDTVPFKGTQLLYPFTIATSGPLDLSGLASLDVFVPPALSGVDLAAQLVTLDGGFVGASAVREVSFVP